MAAAATTATAFQQCSRLREHVLPATLRAAAQSAGSLSYSIRGDFGCFVLHGVKFRGPVLHAVGARTGVLDPEN